MEKPIGRILLSSLILVAVAIAAYVLNMLDQIVHGQLYSYGLLFDLAWASPYWDLLRIMQALFGVIAALASVSIIFTVGKYVSVKKQTVKVTPGQKPVVYAPRTFRPISPRVRVVPAPMRAVEKVSATPGTPAANNVVPLAKANVLQSQVPSATPRAPSAFTPTRPSTSAPLSPDTPGMINCTHCGKVFTQPLRMLDFQGDRPRIVNICPFCNEIITTAARKEENDKDSRFPFGKKSNNSSSKVLTSQ